MYNGTAWRNNYAGPLHFAFCSAAGTFLKPADAELQSKVAKLFGRADAVSDTESVISD